MTAQSYKSAPIYRLQMVNEGKVDSLIKVVDEKASGEIFHAYLHDRHTEHMAVLLLDAQMNFLGISTVGVGGMSGVHISIRDVMTHLFVGRAHSFIIGHNHPSGNVFPSPQDIAFTNRIKQAAEIIGCPLLDHIIVSSGHQKEIYSFLSNGLL